ncbi:DNA replication and repair protein RecO [Pelagirhabdus alkalitolerans]|uniref:DNA repair protein RecO n=1 Tax=Pelagirhabdus alkalitolerans TaxID=1612202 RepID=A0A1G6HW53_9BACI|nr:DNA repair protein RecO [Pelagirhabdus alkalitolerans]SDB98492.1 DNA replication and repair protein RecO [Pelagirhabdus alkalitolerans]
MFEKVEGIIIRTQDYGETHKIVSILSKQFGKFQAIARGAKKPKSRMASVTQLFIEADYLVQLKSGLSVLQQGEVIQSNRYIREDIVAAAYASYLAELSDKMLEDKQANLFIYQQLKSTLSEISEKKDAMTLAMMYELKLYRLAGFAPVVDQCVKCSSLDLKGFSIIEGGVICSRCSHQVEDMRSLTDTQLKLLRLFYDVDVSRVQNIQVKDENKNALRELLDDYYDQYGGFIIKSKNFLKQLDLLQ